MKKVFLYVLLGSVGCQSMNFASDENIELLDVGNNSMIIPECPEDTDDILSKSPNND